MKILILVLLHAALLIGCFLGLIGSAKEYAVPIIIQEIFSLVSFVGFILLFKKTASPYLKVYFVLLTLVALFFILDGIARLFFEHRLSDFIQ